MKSKKSDTITKDIPSKPPPSTSKESSMETASSKEKNANEVKPGATGLSLLANYSGSDSGSD